MNEAMGARNAAWLMWNIGLIALFAAVVLAALPFHLAAQEPGDAAEGRRLAGM